MKEWLFGVGLQVAVVMAFVILMVIVLPFVKRFRARESEERTFAAAETVTGVLLAVLLLAGIVFVTLKYS